MKKNLKSKIKKNLKKILKKTLKKKLKTKLKRKINTKSRFIQYGGIDNKTTKLLKLPKLPESLVISYSSTYKNSKQIFINNNIDLTGKDDYYINIPSILIINANPNKLYMVTMIDPDAPYGENAENAKNKNNGYIHLVYIQTNKSKIIYVPYAPPSPPMGIHRYQFNLYDITNKSIYNVQKHIASTDLQIIKVTKEDMNKPDFRKAYNEKLLSFLNIRGFKLLFTIQFKVTSKDMINKTKNAKIKNTAQQSINQSTQQTTQQSNTQQQQQQQLQLQQKQIKYLQEQNKNRVGFGTFLAADLTGSAIFSLF
jgi:phosphatidylethanolamine-binding protein (PEBP) family uncharacterized protein